MEDKIAAFEKVAGRIADLRAKKPNSVIVLCHGCFDIVHPGHIRHLKFAREQGTFLVVSITPDICIQKGSNRPLMPQTLRAENLAALEIVDMVTIAPADTGIEPIQAVRPDIYVKGSEYAVSSDPRFLKEKELVESQGGSLVYSSGDVVFSSTELIREHDMGLAIGEKLNYICKRYKIGKALLQGIVSRAPELKILIAGEALLDERMQCEGLGMAQESPVLSLSLKHKSLSVGGAGAIALHLAAIGVKTRFLTATKPEGSNYQAFKMALEEGGVELVNVVDRFRQVGVKSSVMVDHNKVLELETSSYRPLDSSLRNALLKQFKEEAKAKPDLLMLSDYGYGLLADALVSPMLGEGLKSMADISMTPRTNLRKFSGAKAITVTEAELRACMHDYENGLSVIVDRFYRTQATESLYLMLADGGLLYFRRPGQSQFTMENVHIPPLAPKEEGRTGLTEAFSAGVALGCAAGMEPEPCVYLAALLTAVKASSPASAKTVEVERLLRLIDERKELS